MIRYVLLHILSRQKRTFSLFFSALCREQISSTHISKKDMSRSNKSDSGQFLRPQHDNTCEFTLIISVESPAASDDENDDETTSTVFRKKRIHWHDALLEDLFSAACDVEVYSYHGRRDLEEAFEDVAGLVEAKNPGCGVDKRNAKTQFKKQISKFNKAQKQRRKTSGIAHELSSVEKAVNSYLSLAEVKYSCFFC
jgi:hypothetical protein